MLAPTGRAQLHEDSRYGIKFKAPKDFNSVALNPREWITIAKFQSDSREYGGAQGRAALNRSFWVQFYPTGTRDEDLPEDDDDDTDGGDGGDEGDEFDDFEDKLKKEKEAEPDVPPMERAWNRVASGFGLHEVVKSKKIKVEKQNREERHFQTIDTDGNPSDVMYWVAVHESDDGVFVFYGDAFAKNFSKAASEYARSAKSFKRIDKDGSLTGLGAILVEQLGDQEAFLQAQIDKLPADWGHYRSDRYLFLYNAEKNFVVKTVAPQIEAMRDEYEKIYVPTKPIEAVSIVRIVNSADEYRAYGGPANSNGYWLDVDRELVLFDRRPREQMLETLNHEAFHQYIYYWAGELAPHTWYNEGHGEYFAGARMTRTHRVTGYGPRVYTQRLPPLRRALGATERGDSFEEGALWHIRDILSASRSTAYGDPFGRFYPQAWAITFMLREGKLQPEWKTILPEYMDNLQAARIEIAEEAMNESLELAEKDEKGSSKEMSRDPKDYFRYVNREKLQDLTFEKSFGQWTDEDWEELNDAYMKFCDDL